MPHDIEVIDGRASFFSAREVPWHGLGIVTPNALTARDAIKTAQLDWTVSLHPLEANIDGQYVKVDDRLAVIRSSDNKALGTVGTHYVPFDNAEAFRFMDNLVDSADAKYETAGSLRGGKIVFMTMKLPLEVRVGKEDLHEVYLLLRTSHDGTKAISVYVTPIRVVCQNTLSLAIYDAKQKWSVTHVSTVHDRLAEAKTTLDLTYKYLEDFREDAETLLSVKVSDNQFSDLLDSVLPDRPKTPEVKAAITQVYKTSPTVGYVGNGWGALNAISEYFEWHRRTSSAEARFISLIDGQGFKARNTAMSLLLAAA